VLQLGIDSHRTDPLTHLSLTVQGFTSVVRRLLELAPRVVALGGDCLPTLGRAIVPDARGAAPRFEPWTRAEAAVMMEAGDGRVTRASVLASHLPDADASDLASGLPEIRSAFFGAADHHGIYGEATFQSVLLRILLRSTRRRAPQALPLG